MFHDCCSSTACCKECSLSSESHSLQHAVGGRVVCFRETDPCCRRRYRQLQWGPKVKGMSLEPTRRAVAASIGTFSEHLLSRFRCETAVAARQDMGKLEGSPFAVFSFFWARQPRRFGNGAGWGVKQTLQTHSSSPSLPYGPARRVEQPLGCSTCVARGSGSR